MEILIVGDVFSKLGRASFERHVNQIKQERKINFIIVNGENISHGRGINDKHFKWLLEMGVNVVTLGNHSYQNDKVFTFIDESQNIIRPYNYPEGSRGKGYTTINYNGKKITVFQMIGTVFMEEGNASPFEKTEEILKTIPSDCYICDFHGEATSEKIAFGHYFDGRVQIIFGTHTHVPTNDARILPNHSAYITDVGMTGPLDGVIGMQKDIVLDRFVNKGTKRFAPQDTGRTQFNAIIVELNEKTCVPVKIETIHIIE
ncbi:MAG: TIGR00282 family metallophosphoesterase [Bacilli bacterium]|jgi:metallophosphoesterase (TIGR00282 family)|nr:TIGR00282 family metallophosphoesterase [Bacilli bacterium]MDY0064335.1 TIGR00282 family metallophosphoesterase [Bacilli bacterium]